jgi:hypothetical protein
MLNSSAIAGNNIAVDTKMYPVEPVYGATAMKPTAETKMYQVENLYNA